MTAYAFPDRDSPDPRVHIRGARKRVVGDGAMRSVSLCGTVVLADRGAPEPDGVAIRLCKRCERMAAKRGAS